MRAISASARDPHVKAAFQYAEQVTTGKIAACSWVRKACQRSLDDYRRQKSPEFPYRFDPDKASRVCRFVEKLPHIKGPLTGQLIRLEPWQTWILCQVFGYVHASGPLTGKRRYRRVYIEVPRGNAKSTLSSSVAIYMLAADGEGGAEVYSSATTRDQAKIVFNAAQEMCRRSPDLIKALGIEVAAHTITVPSTASKFIPLSSEGNTLDGLNISLGVIDELHSHPTRTVYDVIETGTGKRNQSLLWIITTAGSDLSGICYEVRTYLTKLLDGVASDESFFGSIWTTDEGDAWNDPETWIKANPNWGVSVFPDHVEALARKAQTMPSAQANFKTKHLDVWVSSDSPYFDMTAWAKCGDRDQTVEQFQGESCVIGLDLATKTDIAAKILLFQRQYGDQTHYYTFGTYYLPEAAIQDGRNSQYSGWSLTGYIRETPGDVLDFARIETDILEDCKNYSVAHVAYDPWQANYLATRLAEHGANVLEYRNVVSNMSAPMKELDALVRSGRFHHNGDPVLAWMASNVVAHVDNKDNVFPRKEKHYNKIDGVVALIQALGVAMNEPVLESPYADLRPIAYAHF